MWTAGIVLGALPWASGGLAQTAATGVDVVGAVNEVIVTGVRGRARTDVDSPVPIDIIPAAELVDSGRAGLKQVLSAAIPSLTLPAQNGGGTSASVPPYAVEGLTGDYVLVLVNGKRRHATALINNLATLGGGSTPVDLDLIPPSAIDHIEYLRDGAAAQYGSDAIAGVINIILKSGGEGGQADTTVGQTYHSTGQLAQENADWGLRLLGGTLHLSMAFLHDAPAPANTASSGVLYPLVGGALDPREASANTNYGSAYGRSTLSNGVNLAYNLDIPLQNGWSFYSFSTASIRSIKDARGAFRPDDLSSLPQIYPNGFQAYRLIHETDFQVAAGVKGDALGWRWDVSSTYGRDYVHLGADDTLNASLGPSVAQTSFFLGTQVFDQWTNNLDVTRSFKVGLAKPLDLSWGLEHRWEAFKEGAGEPNSYLNGGYQIPNDGTPFDDLYAGKYPQAGLQSFTGTSPADASSHKRNNYAAYVDLGTNITTPWYVGLAGRAEHYDDSSGDSYTGKLTTRYEILPNLAIRGSVNNGFHAPSLAEQWFSTTQNTTVVVDGQGVLAQSKFLPAGSAIAKALGATPLTPETSLNYSAGLTYAPTRDIHAAVDVFQIDLENRIVKSAPNFSLTAAQVAALGFPGLSSVQFFTNGVNTRTRGLDASIDWRQSLGDYGIVRWRLSYSGAGTKITRIKASAANFTPLAQRQLTDQAPRYRLSIGPDWTFGRLKVDLHQTLYGGYEEPVNNTLNEVFHPKWVTDLEVAYTVSPRVTLAVGVDNLFNIYPSRVSPAVLAKTADVDSVLTSAPGYSLAAYGLPELGSGQYGTIAPFGLEGGFYYGRLSVKF